MYLEITNNNGSYIIDEKIYQRLYESKMINYFDHRFGTFSGVSEKDIKAGHCRELTKSERDYSDQIALPRYWMESAVVKEKLDNIACGRGWLFIYRMITNVTNERTLISSVIPKNPVGNSAYLISSKENGFKIACLLSNFNCFVLDYFARQKLGGTNLNVFILKQLPVIPPKFYKSNSLGVIVPKVLELTYTAWDIKAFADDLWREADESLRAALKQQWDENVAETDGGHAGTEAPSWAEIAPDGFPYPPFKWDEERRARLRAELDAIYAHLYGLTREELDYILETFPIVKRKDVEKYGSYRTKELILDYYEEYSDKLDYVHVEVK